MAVLISVHVAKAGGSSLLKIFETAFGDGLLRDYAENPADPTSPRLLDPDRYFARGQKIPGGVDCVHGHFHPGKYEIPRDAVLSTILRDPVENIISIFTFWKSIGRGHDALHDYFMDQGLSILETAKLPLLRHLFSETYFGGFDMGRFDIIGRHDRRGVALEKLGALMGKRFEADVRENVTVASEERLAMAADPKLRAALEDILMRDIAFYERHAR
jgi:hypothetical protein